MAGHGRRVRRGLNTGVRRHEDPVWVDGSLDQPGDPGMPIDLGIVATGVPWIEGLEDPFAVTGLGQGPDPAISRPDTGWRPIVGAYNGDYATQGPAGSWPGEERQAAGRTMLFRFPLAMSAPGAGLPIFGWELEHGSSGTADNSGVQDTGWQSEMAVNTAYNDLAPPSDSEVLSDLIMLPNIGGTQ